MCRVEAQQRESNVGGAACLIKIDKWLVTTANRHSSGLDIPGGAGQSGESAQCTAHRHTWEQTGFNVEVGRYLGQTDSGLRVYHCRLPPAFTAELKTYPVPEWVESDISSIQLSNPFELELRDWQRDKELIALREWFNKARD
jgi:ADP-ribose pyrophosphatase YjhB (NUDIX family)